MVHQSSGHGLVVSSRVLPHLLQGGVVEHPCHRPLHHLLAQEVQDLLHLLPWVLQGGCHGEAGKKPGRGNWATFPSIPPSPSSCPHRRGRGVAPPASSPTSSTRAHARTCRPLQDAVKGLAEKWHGEEHPSHGVSGWAPWGSAPTFASHEGLQELTQCAGVRVHLGHLVEVVVGKDDILGLRAM